MESKKQKQSANLPAMNVKNNVLFLILFKNELVYFISTVQNIFEGSKGDWKYHSKKLASEFWGSV